MNQFDKKIIQLAKQTKCKTSQEFEERIEHLLAGLKESPDTSFQKRTSFSFSKAIAVVCTFAAVILIAMPVSAKVSSYVKERMQQMNEAQLEEYQNITAQENMTTEHNTEAIQYSRELSGEEETRYRDLFIRYENEGLFPDKEMPAIDQWENHSGVTPPFYETYHNEFYLPESSLTDEELLEMIDFVHKADYVTSQTPKARQAIEEQEAFWSDPHPGEGALSEAEAIETAASYLERILDKDCSAMDKTVEYWIGYSAEGYGEYKVTFKAGEGESYLVDITKDRGTLAQIIFTLNGINYASYCRPSVPADEQLLRSRYETAREMLAGVLDPDVTIIKSTCEYLPDENGYIDTGRAYYYFELSNGYVYQIEYCIEDDICPFLFLVLTTGNYAPLPETVVIPMEP